MVGWIGVMVGVFGLATSLRHYLALRAPGFGARQGGADDIAFGLLVIAAGISWIADMS